MAQRIRSCSNNMGFDTINCESYMNRLLKPEKPKTAGKPSRCPRDQSASNIKSSGTVTLASSMPTNPRARLGSYRPPNVLPPKTRSNPTNFTHKEVVPDDAAMVEVTVRTHTGRQLRGGDGVQNSGAPWAKLLTSTKSNDALSPFGSFDPLRTLHFLAKELQSKLKSIVPENSKVSEMLLDMQHAVNRVPPEIAATIRLQQDLENTQLKRASSGTSSESQNYKNERPEKLTPIKPSMEDKICQTTHSNTTPHLQKQLEESTAKLDASCKQMEMVCNQLKSEKEQVEHLLRAEKDTVTFLRKHIEDLETEKIESSNLVLERLAQERNALQLQVKTLQAQINSHHGPSLQELKSRVNELEMNKSVVEQENSSLRNKLTLSNMEKEKYITMLNVRDRQINEIKTEMNQLQEVVNDQLMELQKAPFMSSPSSQLTVPGNYNSRHKAQTSNNAKQNTEIRDNFAPSSSTSNSPVQQLFTNDAMINSFRELHSGDSSASYFESQSSKIMKNVQEVAFAAKKSDLRSPNGLTVEKIITTGHTESANGGAHSSMRGMFTDLKRPALTMNSPLLHQSTDHHLQDTHRSNK